MIKGGLPRGLGVPLPGWAGDGATCPGSGGGSGAPGLPAVCPPTTSPTCPPEASGLMGWQGAGAGARAARQLLAPLHPHFHPARPADPLRWRQNRTPAGGSSTWQAADPRFLPEKEAGKRGPGDTAPDSAGRLPEVRFPASLQSVLLGSQEGSRDGALGICR